MRRKDRSAKDSSAKEQPAKDRSAAPSSPLAASTAERLAAIVEAAERAAVTVIDDAEKQAREHLEQAEAEADRLVAERLASLAELTDTLVAQGEEIHTRSERLLASLEEAKRRLATADGSESQRATHLTAVAPAEDPALPESIELEAEVAEVTTPAGARLLATQMAVSGNSRAEIDARLRNGFEIEDTAAILDAILGPED